MSLRPSPGEFPNLDAHYQRMLVRPAVCKTCAIEAAIGYELPASIFALRRESALAGPTTLNLPSRHPAWRIVFGRARRVTGR
jgi:hypothetical protein